MRAGTLRVSFVTLLLASVAANLLGGPSGADWFGKSVDIESRVIEFLQSQGFIYRETREVTTGSLRSLVFEAPGCTRDLQVVPLSVTFEDRPRFDRIDQPGDRRRFIYLDRSSAVEDRIGMFLERAKHTALTLLRQTRYVPYRNMLMVTEPFDCHAAETVDWRPIWDRQYPARITQ